MLFALLFVSAVSQAAQAQHDVVLLNGHVIDPESGLNEVRNIGVSDGKIVEISEAALSGKTTLDLKGKVVAPGFIDLHSHAMSPLGQRYQLLDGVTTALELEAGAYPVAAVGNVIADEPLINFGASAGHYAMRIKVVEQRDMPYFFFNRQRLSFESEGFKAPLNDNQLDKLRRHLHLGLDQGGLGIGLLLDYMSDAVNDQELNMIFEVAAERQAPVFVHMRRGLAGDPVGLKELLQVARHTGAPVHICHLAANAIDGIDTFLALVQEAREDGVDVTVESYPYEAGSTSIGADVFNRDWQKVFGISYEDVQLAATGEYFTEESWNRVRQEDPNAMIIHHYGRSDWTERAIQTPGMMVASDAMPVFSEKIKAHPRGMGTFSRVIGRYVRDKQLLDLPAALSKMTIEPARRLEQVAPAFKRKGRIQVGADADIVVFDLKLIQDNATYTEPHQPSTGIETILINGIVVVSDGEIREGVFPGRMMIGGN
ncbi:MAG: amidohydrolase family protein [Pseudomonadales bacterium]|nr:amidohydrolase family protein [Pseudomonadales bacterium]